MKLPKFILRRAKPAAAPVHTGADYLQLEFPLHTVSEANTRDDWRTKARRVRHQREAVQLMLGRLNLPALPAVITLTRLGVGKLDDDNLAISMKALRDQIAEIYGVDDGDPRYVWRVEQEKCPTCKVRITIQPIGQGGGTNG